MTRASKQSLVRNRFNLVKYRGPEDKDYSFFWTYDNVAVSEYFTSQEAAEEWLVATIKFTKEKVNGESS